jgi:hypothetical protein
MLPNETEIRLKLTAKEDNFVERKRSAQTYEIRKTLVAFANSVPEGQYAILFIGVEDAGKVVGVKGTDALQKTIRKIGEQECYPPVTVSCVVVEEAGRDVLAVIVGHSTQRPHFDGHSYVRHGSESVKATKEQYEMLIASRNEKAARIIPYIGKRVDVQWRNPPEPATGDMFTAYVNLMRREYVIEACDAHCVKIEDRNHGRLYPIPMKNVLIRSVSSDPELSLFIDE